MLKQIKRFQWQNYVTLLLQQAAVMRQTRVTSPAVVREEDRAQYMRLSD